MIDMFENGLGGEFIDLFGMIDYCYCLDVFVVMMLICLSEYFGVFNV